MTDQEGINGQTPPKKGQNGPENAVFGGEKVAAKEYSTKSVDKKPSSNKWREAAILRKASRIGLTGTGLGFRAMDVITGLQLALWVFNREGVGIAKTQFIDFAQGENEYVFRRNLRECLKRGIIEEFRNRRGKAGTYYDLSDKGRAILRRFDQAYDMIEEDMRDRRRQRVEKVPGTKDAPKRYRRPHEPISL